MRRLQTKKDNTRIGASVEEPQGQKPLIHVSGVVHAFPFHMYRISSSQSTGRAVLKTQIRGDNLA